MLICHASNYHTYTESICLAMQINWSVHPNSLITRTSSEGYFRFVEIPYMLMPHTVMLHSGWIL